MKIIIHNTLAQLKITALVLILLSSFVEVQSIRFYITHVGEQLINNSYVQLSQHQNNTLQCRTSLPSRLCCDSPSHGGWYFPNGSRLMNESSSRSVYQTRHSQRVDVHYRQGSPVISGIYTCSIETAYAYSYQSIVYVGVYFSQGEKVLSHCVGGSKAFSSVIIQLKLIIRYNFPAGKLGSYTPLTPSTVN